MAQTPFRFVFFTTIIIFFSLFAGLSVSPLIAAASSSSGPRLRVLVPYKVGFEEFVNWTGSPHHDPALNATFDGFCVQVFRKAMSLLRNPPAPAFDFVGLGDGRTSPSYDHMVDMVHNGEADIIVADLTITRNRTEKVDFTLPYIQSSLVMVVPLTYGKANTMWDFLHPFSLQLWLVIGCAFLTTGLVLYILENKNPEFMKDSKHGKHRSLPNPEPVGSTTMRGSPTSNTNCSTRTDSMQPHICERSPLEVPSYPNGENSCNNGHADVNDNTTTEPAFDGSLETEAQHSVPSPVNSPVSHKQRLLNAYWFTSLCVFFSQQEYVRTHTGRIVTVAWLFTTLIFYSSYTASLASQLSAQQLFPAIQGYEALLKSNTQLVGCQNGSFVKNYLRLLGFPNRRLKTYASKDDYVNALQPGSKVGAVLDETPYVQILLQKQCNALTTVGDQIAYFGGFGFAVSKNLSSLTDRISEGILEMAENGTLQKLKDEYLGKNGGCKPNTAPDHLQFKRFAGLFIIFGGLYAICLLWRIATKAKLPSWINAITRRHLTSRSLSRGSRRVADDSGIIL